ncbi:MAG TPA: hypothetical protein O0X27_03105 [Methanocorpusculum sp.]|nr:hypothetical protein [Methanocorpusculum sp.]
MARIYFDPDKDELVSTRKLTAKERAALQRMLDEDDDFDDDDVSQDREIARIRAESARRRAEIDEEMLRRMDDLEDAIRENTEAVQMNGYAAQERHDRDLGAAATIAGGILGYKLTSDLIDGFVDAINPFSSGCECKKKKWF